MPISFSPLFSIPQEEEPTLAGSRVVSLKGLTQHTRPGGGYQDAKRGLLSPITAMANATKTPAMRMPFMMLGLASPKGGAAEPQTWKDTKRVARSLGGITTIKSVLKTLKHAYYWVCPCFWGRKISPAWVDRTVTLICPVLIQG